MKLINWIVKSNEKTENKNVETSTPLCHQKVTESFESLINENIKPFLKPHGFRKKGLTFYKQNNEVTNVINFQKSQGNTSDFIKFYINIGIYSSLIDKTIGKIELKEPKEYECQYRVRVSNLTNSEDGYSIDESTDLKLLNDRLTNDLSIVLKHFEQYSTVFELTNLMTDYNSLDYSLFDYFVLTNNSEALRKQLHRISELWSSESRWNRIVNDLNMRLKDYNRNQTIEEILENK